MTLTIGLGRVAEQMLEYLAEHNAALTERIARDLRYSSSTITRNGRALQGAGLVTSVPSRGNMLGWRLTVDGIIRANGIARANPPEITLKLTDHQEEPGPLEWVKDANKGWNLTAATQGEDGSTETVPLQWVKDVKWGAAVIEAATIAPPETYAVPPRHQPPEDSREDQEELIWSWVYGLRRPDLANASRRRIEALYDALTLT